MPNGLRQDLSYAFRQIARRPAFAAVIVLPMATAMGVNTALFAVLNTTMLQPWPVAHPETLVLARSLRRAAVAPAEWRYWSAHAKSFRHLAATHYPSRARSEGRRLSVEPVSGGYFEALGISMARGRGFRPEDDYGVPPAATAVLSHHLWAAQLDSDPAVVGRSILVDGVALTVVGVAEEGFRGTSRGGDRIDLWMPLSGHARLTSAERLPKDNIQDTRGFVLVAGRLREGVSPMQAEAELNLLSGQFRRQHALPIERIVVIGTEPLALASAHGNDRLSAQLRIGAVLLGLTFITLVACANVANLLLVRGYARRGEIAVRLALGAGRARVVRQLLLECLVLATLASVLGMAISALLPGAVLTMLPADITDRHSFDLPTNPRVVSYALGVALLASLAFGLAPALQCTRLSVGNVLKDAHGLAIPRLKSSLPSYQVTLSVMLLTIAGLLLRGAQHAYRRDPGYSVENLHILRLEYPSRYSQADRRAFATALTEALQQTAGAENVAAANVPPIPTVRALGQELQIQVGEGPGSRWTSVRRIEVSPRYFDLLRVPFVTGRRFEPTDTAESTVIVNEAFVRQHWPGQTGLGRTVSWDRLPRRVVGVTRDAHLSSLEAVPPLIFQPGSPERMGSILVRAAGDPAARMLAPLARRVDPGVHVEISSGPAAHARAMSLSLFGAKAVGSLALLALALASFGLFSVSAYTVQQRTREIGIRMTLGARPAHILHTVLGQASQALLRGFVVGGLGAVLASFLLRRSLYGLNPLDPATYAGVAIVLATAGLIAAYLPARRAMRVEPTVALRYE